MARTSRRRFARIDEMPLRPHHTTADPRTFVLTGLPRSGTTYLAAVLYRPPSVITLSEAGGEWRRFHREHGRSARVLELIADFRKRIEQGESMMSFANTPGYEGRGRVDTWNQKKSEQQIPVEPGFHLGLKNPEIFLDLLPVLLAGGMKCVISVRHPASILNSWVKQARERERHGRSAEGTFADGECVFFRSDAADVVTRRIDLHNHLAGLIAAQLRHPNLLTVRHEDWSVEQLNRVCEFLCIPSAGRLQPPVIAPDPISLSPDECERIARECAIAAEYGYPMSAGGLLDSQHLCAGSAA